MNRRSLVFCCACILLGGGAAWLITGELGTILFAQPAPDSSAANWELRVKRVGVNLYDNTRFNRVTGEAWQLHEGQWKKIAETGAVPKGDYDIEIAGEEADPGVWVVRIDRTTGKTWQRKAFQWVSLPDAH